MKLNRVEKALMNNPVRALLQWHYEAPLLEHVGGRVDGMRALEIGCGRGIGTEIILKRFGAERVYAFDLDLDLVQQAHRRLAACPAHAVQLGVADASAIPAEDESFDAVFDYGVIHHLPDWRAAVSEIRRVLRHDGRFFFEEVTRQALGRWLYRTFLQHPTQDRFSGEEFVAELERQGIVVDRNVVHRFRGDFILGVGRRTRRPADERKERLT